MYIHNVTYFVEIANGMQGRELPPGELLVLISSVRRSEALVRIFLSFFWPPGLAVRMNKMNADYAGPHNNHAFSMLCQVIDMFIEHPIWYVDSKRRQWAGLVTRVQSLLQKQCSYSLALTYTRHQNIEEKTQRNYLFILWLYMYIQSMCQSLLYHSKQLNFTFFFINKVVKNRR